MARGWVFCADAVDFFIRFLLLKQGIKNFLQTKGFKKKALFQFPLSNSYLKSLFNVVIME